MAGLANRDARAALILVDEAPKDQMDAVPVVEKRNWAQLAVGRYAEARKGIDRVLATGKVPEGLLQDAALKLHQKDYAGARKSAKEALSKTPGKHSRSARPGGELYRAEAGTGGDPTDPGIRDDRADRPPFSSFSGKFWLWGATALERARPSRRQRSRGPALWKPIIPWRNSMLPKARWMTPARGSWPLYPSSRQQEGPFDFGGI